jgi:hypothetical protein
LTQHEEEQKKMVSIFEKHLEEQKKVVLKSDQTMVPTYENDAVVAKLRKDNNELLKEIENKNIEIQKQKIEVQANQVRLDELLKKLNSSDIKIKSRKSQTLPIKPLTLSRFKSQRALVDRLKVSLRCALEKSSKKEKRILQLKSKIEDLNLSNMNAKTNMNELKKQMESREVVKKLMEEEYLQQIVRLKKKNTACQNRVCRSVGANNHNDLPLMSSTLSTPSNEYVNLIERSVNEAVLMSIALKRIKQRGSTK